MSKRESMHISLPPELREFVRAAMERGGFASESEYVRNLVREERKRSARADLDAVLLEGVTSGEPREFNDELRQEIRRRAERLARGDDASR